MSIPDGNIKGFNILCSECLNNSIDRCEYCSQWKCDLHFYGNKECVHCHFKYKVNLDENIMGFGAKP